MKKIGIIIIIAFILCGCGQTVPEDTSATVDKSAPDFTMYTEDGTEVKLSDFEGKPTILNFWATWCTPCKNEMPAIEAAYQQYGDKINFVIVNLTDGENDTVVSAAAYIQAQGYTFPVYFDTKLAGANAYGVSSIPLTLFIDANGDLVTYYTGSMSEKILQSGINMLLPVTE